MSLSDASQEPMGAGGGQFRSSGLKQSFLSKAS